MADNSSQSLHFNEYFKVIRNRLWVIFTIVVLCAATGEYVVQWVLPKIYTASSEIEIRPGGEKTVGGIDGSSPDRSFDPTAFQAEFEILQSPDVLLPIVNDLHLDQIWAKRDKRGVDKMPPLDALAKLKNVLKLDLKRGTDIVELTASSEDPVEAADIANALADRYKTMRDVQEDQKNTKGADSIREEIDEQQKVVDEKKALVDKLREDAAKRNVDLTPAITGGDDRLETDLQERQKDLLAAKVDYDARRVLLEQVQNLPDDEFVNTLGALGRQESNIAALRSQVFATEGDIDNLLKDGFEENHPRIQALRAENDRRHQQIKDLIAGTRRAMVVDADMAQSRVTLLQTEVDKLKEVVRQHVASDVEPYRQAQRDVDEQQSILAAMTLRVKQVDANKQLLGSGPAGTTWWPACGTRRARGRTRRARRALECAETPCLPSPSLRDRVQPALSNFHCTCTIPTAHWPRQELLSTCGASLRSASLSFCPAARGSAHSSTTLSPCRA